MEIAAVIGGVMIGWLIWGRRPRRHHADSLEADQLRHSLERAVNALLSIEEDLDWIEEEAE